MQATLIVCFVVQCFTLFGNAQQPQTPSQQAIDDVFPRPASGKAKFDSFDWELAKAMGINNANEENVVVSPISLKVVLATLFDGANGTTADEIANALRFDKNDRQSLRQNYSEILKSLRTTSSRLISDVETRVYAHQTARLNKNFVKVMKDNYGTGVESVDFKQPLKVIKTINNWAEVVTHGHIKDLLVEGDVDESAVMLLLNVIFFNGLWKLPFAENETTVEPFYLNENHSINVPMMKAKHALEYVESYDYNIQLIRMPYLDGSFAMYFILPGNRTTINSLIANITPERVHALMQGLTETNVELSIPKFDFSYDVKLKPILHSFGIHTMFSSLADFTNMEEAHNLYVHNIIQKSGIEINEKGSTAYASTVVDLFNKWGGEDATKKFNANRPFLFFIEEDKTRTVVFVGKMSNPSADTPPAPALPPSVEVNPGTILLPGALQPPQPDRRPEPHISPEWERISFFDTELLDEIGYKTLGNFVISPASIKSVLGLLLQGSSGKTASELQATLRLPQEIAEAQEQLHFIQNSIRNSSSNSVMVKSANALFVSYDLKPKEDFKRFALTHYNAPVYPINYQQPKTSILVINKWVNDQTNGFIPNILEQGELKPDFVLVVVNAMYFKGNWMYKFATTDTKIKPFFKTPNQIQYTNMMHITGYFKHSYVPSLQAQVVQLPYEDKRYSLVVVLPKKKDGIAQVMRDLKHNPLLRILNQQEDFEVILQLPRFTIEYNTDIVDCLRDMRTKEIFSDDAHLQNIAEGNRKLKVTKIVHKAKIEVNEKGTTAAATTSAAVVPLMTPLQATFTADHPFLFFIYNMRDGIILFEGRVDQPEVRTKAEYEQSLKLNEEQPILNRITPDIDVRTQNVNPPKSPVYAGVPNVAAASEQHQPSVVTQRSTGPYNRIPQPVEYPSLVANENIQPGQTYTTQQQYFSSGPVQTVNYKKISTASHHRTSSETKTSSHSSSVSITHYPTTHVTNNSNNFQRPPNVTDTDAIQFMNT